MSHGRLIDDLIAKVTGLKASIQHLIELYDQMPNLLEGDKKALAHSDLVELENLSIRKMAVADAIEHNFSALRDGIAEIERYSKGINNAPRLPVPNTLSNTVQWLENIGHTLEVGGFAAQVYLHVTKGIAQLAAELLTKHEAAKPILEANKYMMERVLVFKQESYRFWQDVANVAMSSYNEHGTQTAATATKSVLRIRA